MFAEIVLGLPGSFDFYFTYEDPSSDAVSASPERLKREGGFRVDPDLFLGQEGLYCEGIF